MARGAAVGLVFPTPASPTTRTSRAIEVMAAPGAFVGREGALSRLVAALGGGAYQLFEAERPKSPAEQRAADDRSGELAAAMARPIRAARARMRAAMTTRHPPADLSGPPTPARSRHDRPRPGQRFGIPAMNRDQP